MIDEKIQAAAATLTDVESAKLALGESNEINRLLHETYEQARPLVEGIAEGKVSPDDAGILRNYLEQEAHTRERGSIGGLNFANVWFDRVIEGAQRGQDTEFEIGGLTRATGKEEEAQRALLEELLHSIPNSRLVVSRSQEGISAEEVRKMASVLAEGVEVDKFLVLEERSMGERVEGILLPALRLKSETSLFERDGELWWKPREVENPLVFLDDAPDGSLTRLPGIKLREASGEWTREALGAVSFANSINKSLQHIVVQPESRMRERDRIWEIISALGIPVSSYHDIFYSEKAADADPEEMRRAMQLAIRAGNEMVKEAEAGRSREQMDFWNKFDPVEYVDRNYGKKILPEDAEIMKMVIKALHDLGVQPGSMSRVADIGAGPNLYALMLLAPYLSKDGVMIAKEYGPRNREYLEWATGPDAEKGESPFKEKLAGIWEKFEEAMRAQDPAYEGALATVRSRMHPEFGDVRELERGENDMATSFFVSESITSNLIEFAFATAKVIYSVKPGGVFVIAHMAGSQGYYAGENTKFPASKLSLEELQSFYDTLLGAGNFDIHEASDEHEKAREGYHGMVVVTARVPETMRSLAEMGEWALQLERNRHAGV